MIPTTFDEANSSFGPPQSLDEQQCGTVSAWSGTAVGGSCDGVELVVVAWKPSPADIAQILAGAPVFLTCLGGLPPHFLSTDFRTATHPR